ncbi:carbohydrate ABC transporter permease [Cohnella soli]|uniref:Carbohydrate ABC transporter permease n=1 Tax=Cohnella soli TaxID=425005 RepID=A0ABW0I041_9BACL
MRSAINRKNRLSQSIIYAVLIFFCLLCIIPFLLILSISLSDEQAISDSGYSIFPIHFTTYAYEYIFKFPDLILNAYQVTTLVTVIGTVLGLLVTAMLAYPLSRNHLKYRNAISFYIFFTLLCNGGMVSWYIITTQYLHLKENIWALIIPYLANSWYVLLLRNFFRAVPDALIEAAKLEGAGDFRIFYQIALPLAKPGLATIALFIALGYWNDWWLGLMLITGNESAVPLQLLLYRLMSTLQFLQSNPEAASKGIMIPGESARMATCVLVIGPIIFVYPFFQKYFVKGLIVGAVKS